MLMFMKLVAMYLIACKIRATSAAGNNCSENFAISTWNFSRSPPPTNLTSRLNESMKSIEVRSSQIKEDFCLSLFAIPLDNSDMANCSDVLIERYPDTRKFHGSYASSDCRDEHDNNTLFISYDKIFRGCYYFVMSNVDTGETWQLPPQIYKTNYSLVDTRVSIYNNMPKKNTWIIPGDSKIERHMYIRLRVPLDCMSVEVALYELEANISSDVTNDMRKWKIPETQRYLFRKVPEKIKPTVESAVSQLITDIQLEVEISEVNETMDSKSESSDGYIATVHWTKLGRKPGTYYFYHRGYFNTPLCYSRYGTSDLDTWNLLHQDDLVEIDRFDGYNEPPPTRDSNSFWLQTTISVFVVALALIMVFWIAKYYRIRKRMYVAPTDLPEVVMKSQFVPYDKNSDRIMLIYVEDSPLFKEKIDNLRDDLKKGHCFDVHDMFDPEEWRKIGQFGKQWVEELLKVGSKVIWVDTPRFRSYVNDPRREEIDFRGPAISYALSLATDLFTNSSTQYLRHFVVRVEGFEVTDGYDDPLLVISPYTRYHLPEHLEQLHKDLSDGTNENWKEQRIRMQA